MLTVYLAGPVLVTSDWRQQLEAAISMAERRDQRVLAPLRLIHPGGRLLIPDGDDPELRSDLYVPADLVSIRHADMVVAWLTADHAGRGTAVEIGYALGLGKPVLPILPDGMQDSRKEDGALYAWRFTMGLVPATYSLASAAAAIVHAAHQLDGSRPG